jgi:hypothetical protein
MDEDPLRARALLEEGLSTQPLSPWAHYDLACWHARFGAAEDAATLLSRAVELGGDEVRSAAADDPDFDAVRHDPRFRAATG